MTGKETIKRVLEFDGPPRMGYNFQSPGLSDIGWGGAPFVNPNKDGDKFRAWGRHPELLEKTPGFAGEVCLIGGNILGRLGGKTKGECLRAALEDGWGGYEEFAEKHIKPLADPANYQREKFADIRANNKNSGKFLVSGVMALQATVRDARRMENMLADTALEKENLKTFVNDCADAVITHVDMLSECGVDAANMGDDWGLQNALYINPESWRDIWKEPYARVIARLHGHGMKFLLHSCGCVRDIIDDFVEIGVDAFQFDQPALYDFGKLAKSLNGKATLWSPVDIQKILPTGDKVLIQAEARRMIDTFHKNGGLIPKDYPAYGDIGVKTEWAQWAQDIFINFK